LYTRGSRVVEQVFYKVCEAIVSRDGGDEKEKTRSPPRATDHAARTMTDTMTELKEIFEREV